MMDVGLYIAGALPLTPGERRKVELSGWLTLLNGDAVLLQNDFDENLEACRKIKIANFDIVFAVRDRILPLGGGRSFVFHQAKIWGEISYPNNFELSAERLLVKERGEVEFFEIDLSSDNVRKAKLMFERLLENKASDDWIDS